MNIIKPGDLSRMRSTHRFTCERCGCVWEASGAEYRTETDFRNGHYYVCPCPTCGHEAITHPEDEHHG